MTAASLPAAQPRRLRWIAEACIVLAPLGWLLFWAVFHAVPGQDWVVFHTAAVRFFAGDMATLADARAFTDEMNRSHQAWFPHPITVLHPWVYPPVTLMLALAFGKLSYLVSLFAFLGTTLAVLVCCLWRWQDRPSDRLALIGFVLLCPATAYVIGSGQLSFLIAAAVLAGVAWLPSRPFLAGMAFSLLCLKPQFVPLIPVALLAGRHWRAIGGALAGGLGLVALSALVVGVPAWIAWIRLASGLNPLLGSMIDIVRKYDQSVHTCLVIAGAGETVAGIGQMLAIGFSAVFIWQVFARPEPQLRRLKVLLCALVFGSPHVGDYDEIMPAIAAVLTLIDGRSRAWRPGEAFFATSVWLATAFNPPALIAAIGIRPLTLASAASCLLVPGLMIASFNPLGATSGKERKVLLS
jgi:hypothetical protein